MNGKNIGYIRVSSIDQNTARQLEGVTLDKTFIDTCSGKDTRRPGLMACLDYVREGDTLHVHSIDRLARNLQDLLHIIESLKQRAVAVVFHKEGLTFSGKEAPFQKLQLQIIGAVAQFERRCYRGGDGRTRLKVLRCEKQDYIDLAVCIACFAVILASRLVFPNF